MKLSLKNSSSKEITLLLILLVLFVILFSFIARFIFFSKLLPFRYQINCLFIAMVALILGFIRLKKYSDADTREKQIEKLIIPFMILLVFLVIVSFSIVIYMLILSVTGNF